MKLNDYVLILRKSWILIVSVTLICLGGAAVWSLTRTPQYKATTELYVSVRMSDASAGELSQGSTFAQQSVMSYVSIVNRAVVLDPVIEKLNLPATRQELARKITADSPPDTVLIRIHALDADPERAAQIANTTSEVFKDVVANQLESVREGAPARVQVETVQLAEVPLAPISPQVPLSLAIGLFGGLILGVGISIVRSILDTRVRSKEDIASVTDLPVIGTIGKDPEAAKRPLIAVQDPLNPLVESYRVLRTNLRYFEVDGVQNKSVVITSSGPSEGKSTTAANLAIVMADAGQRVALIDADLRKPTIAKKLGIEGEIGLSDVLIGRVSLESAIQQWGRNQLYILPAGRIPPNPSELLGSSAMEKVLEAVSEHFDYVIIDAPPALAVTDAAVLSRMTGGALMIAASDHARRTELGTAIESLKKVDGKIMGIIVTMAPTRGSIDSYGYGAYAYKAYRDTVVPSKDVTSLNLEMSQQHSN